MNTIFLVVIILALSIIGIAGEELKTLLDRERTVKLKSSENLACKIKSFPTH